MGDTVDQGAEGSQSVLHWLDPDGAASAVLRARGAPTAGPRSVTTLRLAAFGLGPEAAQGPLLRAAAGRGPDGRWWFRARPVHLVADLDRVHLLPALVADLTSGEAGHLAARVHDHLASEGGALELLSPTEWLLGTARSWAVSVADPDTAARGALEAALPQGPEARALRSLLTELQMLLHDAPVNATRTGQGRAAVNGLWLWGGGVAPTQPTTGPIRVQGEDVLLQALATLASRASVAMPGPAPGWYEPAPTDAAPFAAAVLGALQRGALRAAEVHVPDLGSWRITPRTAWRLWRRT